MAMPQPPASPSLRSPTKSLVRSALRAQWLGPAKRAAAPIPSAVPGPLPVPGMGGLVEASPAKFTPTLALVLAWKFSCTEMGGPGLTWRVTSSATQLGWVVMSTSPQATLKACPENITVPVGTPFSNSEAVFWPGVTLNVRVAVRDGADAMSWMQETPAGELKRASTRASATGSVFCAEPLQAHASAAAPSVAKERIDIWESP